MVLNHYQQRKCLILQRARRVAQKLPNLHHSDTEERSVADYENESGVGPWAEAFDIAPVTKGHRPHLEQHHTY